MQPEVKQAIVVKLTRLRYAPSRRFAMLFATWVTSINLVKSN